MKTLLHFYTGVYNLTNGDGALNIKHALTKQSSSQGQ